MAIAAGCATVHNHESVIGFGRVLEAHEAAAMSGRSDMGVYRPGMGGAVGGLVAGIIMSIGSESAHTVFVVELSNGTKRWVRSTEKFAVGACVEVRASLAKASETSFALEEASLLSSKECT